MSLSPSPGGAPGKGNRLWRKDEGGRNKKGGGRMRIHQSAEDYLEAILMLRERQGAVRSVDVAMELEYSKASVSVAMKKLRENGYVAADEDGFLSLTPAGEEIAAQIYRRHKALTDFFVSLGVDPEVAARDACGIEHHLSDETFTKLLKHIEGLEASPPSGL